jgi:post-segregation antitoxin (ccd killing protein)
MLEEHKKKMVHLNITIPEDLHTKMKKHPETNWSRVAAKAFERQLRAEEILQQLEEPKRHHYNGYVFKYDTPT